jgi:hypothetical protein
MAPPDLASQLSEPLESASQTQPLPLGWPLLT